MGVSSVLEQKTAFVSYVLKQITVFVSYILKQFARFEQVFSCIKNDKNTLTLIKRHKENMFCIFISHL